MNTLEIELGGKTRTMRATFANMVALEKALGENFTSIVNRFSYDTDGLAMPKNVSFNDIMQIIYYGLHGDASDYMELKAIQKEIEAKGLLEFVPYCMGFLSIALRGANNSKKSEAQTEMPTA